MNALTLSEIAWELGAEYAGGDMPVDHVCTDSRELKPGCMFVALKGENFDGHDFISAALSGGAACAVSEENPERLGVPAGRVLLVKNTRHALLKIAHLYRKRLHAKIVAVTGSVGKTTTKEMIYCVLKSSLKAARTEKNLNNEIGLAKTLLSLPQDTQAAVVEMGSDGPGQIFKMSLSAMPDMAVVTSVGVSHMEKFGSPEAVFNEKLAVAAGMKPGSALILCGDNASLRTVSRPKLDVILYGIENKNCAVRAVNITESLTLASFDILYEGARYPAELPCPGRHNMLNALAAFCVGVKLGIPPEDAAAALKNYKPEGMRQKIVEHKGYTVVEDCYNANPDSMRAALETLGQLACKGRRVAVLSDMLELGGGALQYHRAVGEFAAKSGVSFLLCTGPLSHFYCEGAANRGLERSYHFGTQEYLFNYLKDFIKPGDVVWFKASRGMRLEKVIERLYSE